MTETFTATEPGPEQAKPDHPLMVLRRQLDTRIPELKNALPPHITPERFARTFMTALQLNPELVVANRQSLWNALMRAASDGLMPDGQARCAGHLQRQQREIADVQAADRAMDADGVRSARALPQFRSVQVDHGERSA